MGFLVYLIKKILITVLLLLGITFITFSLTKTLPGDPAISLVGERASPEVLARIRQEIGADKPFMEQYLSYVKMLSRGEMGRSYATRKEVLEEIKAKFPNTIKLALLAMAFAVPLGIGLGFFAALRKDTALDTVLSGASITGISVPVFFSGLVLMMLLSLKLKLLPPSGTGGLRFLVLPAITLALPSIATLARVSRAAVAGIVDMPFVRTAKAKGMSSLKVNAVHILRNALIPIVTVAGLDFGSYLNGAVLTETVFGWDGIGRYAVQGVIRRDYPVVLGTILVGTAVFVIMNMLVDLAYHALDPRVRIYGRGQG
ncbi:MAG: ABC transporter permease [Nitrospiraceae bacterium]|nr:ABC transporter permease [Nitrospiraceae bacterium]